MPEPDGHMPEPDGSARALVAKLEALAGGQTLDQLDPATIDAMDAAVNEHLPLGRVPYDAESERRNVWRRMQQHVVALAVRPLTRARERRPSGERREALTRTPSRSPGRPPRPDDDDLADLEAALT